MWLVVVIALMTEVPGLSQLLLDPGIGARAPHHMAPVVLPSAAQQLTDREIRDMARPHRDALAHCYELALQRDPAFGGIIDVTFTIARDGHVGSVTADGVGGDPDVAACLRTEIGSWRFRAANGTVVVRYPLEFRIAG